MFFSLDKTLQDNAYLFDIDEKLVKKHINGVVFDFNDFSNLDSNFHGFFYFILVYPPFIKKEAWLKFAEFAKLIKKTDCKILTCSIAENQDLIFKLLQLKKCTYQPSIPHLVYQYNFYSNFSNEMLDMKNPEIIE